MTTTVLRLSFPRTGRVILVKGLDDKGCPTCLAPWVPTTDFGPSLRHRGRCRYIPAVNWMYRLDEMHIWNYS